MTWQIEVQALRPSLGQKARESFLSEAQTAARIDREQVVTIYQVCQEEEHAYMAMQWLPGETLESRLHR